MPSEFKLPIQLRWSDLDPNFHMRHSVFYDFGAAARMEFLMANGLSPAVMQQMNFGPILFREEAVFRREIRYGDQYFINVLMTKLRRDFSRFSFRHEITRDDGTLCAVINVDGAWIDTQLRKLARPPELVGQMSEKTPKSADFEWLD